MGQSNFICTWLHEWVESGEIIKRGNIYCTTYYVSGSVRSDSYMWTHLILTAPPSKYYYFPSL